VLAAIQVITSSGSDVELTRDKTNSERIEDANGMIAVKDNTTEVTRYNIVLTSGEAIGGKTMEFALNPAVPEDADVKWELVGAPANGTKLTENVLTLSEDEVGTLMVVANINDAMTYAVINVEEKPKG
jgi:hypothetical protein